MIVLKATVFKPNFLKTIVLFSIFHRRLHNETIVLKTLTSLPATLVMSAPIRSGLGYACTFQAFMGIPGLIRQTIL